MRYSEPHWIGDIIPVLSLLDQPGASRWGKGSTSIAVVYIHNVDHLSCCLCMRTPEENSSWLTQFTLVRTKRWLCVCTGWVLLETYHYLLCSSPQGTFSLLHQAGAGLKENPQNAHSADLCTNCYTLQIHSYCYTLFINVDVAYCDKK